MLKSAIRDPNPVIVLENELLYNYGYPFSDEVRNFQIDPSYECQAVKAGTEWLVPIGKAKIEREGKDVTIVTFSRLVGEALKGRVSQLYHFIDG